ncbi:ribonuclease P protein component [Dysgonomonas sp. PH5-45]|uniref:ribonuclease P protein component n=1 Tax=unclassified Dysgonomonas TaxID=2630389 RepID=UPI002476FD69|nr:MULTISPECIES: ribonuclease P protein component [unclassified Dysgonomonas]MDH6354782.1 ribonuclease P protein component [Dysgonomonas sp. PH5-45]MDH6387681.1 ribonuclease P protein component [Dysgonomonas sp. PH5-37]
MNRQTPSYTFCKEERLCSNKQIDLLFTRGQSFIAYPLRVVYMLRSGDDIPRVAILASVSKKKFKRAVKRNRVKRLIRENYRLNKSEFQAVAHALGQSVDIAFLYLKDELPDFHEIEKAILKAAAVLKQRTVTENRKKEA